MLYIAYYESPSCPALPPSLLLLLPQVRESGCRLREASTLEDSLGSNSLGCEALGDRLVVSVVFGPSPPSLSLSLSLSPSI